MFRSGGPSSADLWLFVVVFPPPAALFRRSRPGPVVVVPPRRRRRRGGGGGRFRNTSRGDAAARRRSIREGGERTQCIYTARGGKSLDEIGRGRDPPPPTATLL
jgi:hypothetical protein